LVVFLGYNVGGLDQVTIVNVAIGDSTSVESVYYFSVETKQKVLH
jgi:hypothetical protein